jgi:hypothetical protein
VKKKKKKMEKKEGSGGLRDGVRRSARKKVKM